MSFHDLALDVSILNTIEKCGYKIPTPVQKQAIPVVLEGSDLCASAQTGTGKTASFILPILQKLKKSNGKKSKDPRVLILAPTRELAQQIADETIRYIRYSTPLRVVCVYGGVPYPVQRRNLSKPYDILIATPGRLIDFIHQGRIRLKNVDTLVLDEADRMLDMGFIDPVTEIAEKTSQDRQTLLFSATLNKAVLKLADHLLKDPKNIAISPEKVTHDHIEQRFHKADDLSHKQRILDHILEDTNKEKVLVFTATKLLADDLVEDLRSKGYKAGVLHGDIRQAKRTFTIGKFKKGTLRILVATDVAARGIDVKNIHQVINFDLPNNVEDYVHRIGRTGRAGESGKALSLASRKDRYILEQIEKFMGKKMDSHEIPGLEAKSWDEKTRSKKKFAKGGKRFLSRPKKATPSDRKPRRSFKDRPRKGVKSQRAK